MREGWTYRKLGDICTSELGKTLNQSKDTGELRPYLCSINVQWDHIDLSTVKQARFEDTDDERYSVTAGDLLVCEGGDIGRAAIWSSSESMLYQNALHRIRFNGSYLPRFYLYYLHFLKTNGTLDAQYGKGVTIKHLVKSSLMSIPVPVPFLAEQKRIVAELDLLQEIIDKQKAQLKELDTLAQTIFYDMFGDPVENEKGWKKTTIGEICTIKGRIGFRGYTREDLVEKGEGAITLSPSNIVNDALDLTKCSYISWYKYEESPEIMIFEGDIIYAKTASIGKVALVRHLPCEATINPQFIVLKNINCDKEYILGYLKSAEFKALANTIVRGVAIPTLSQANFALLPIPVPPLTLQQSFAEKIEAIEHQKASINASIAETQKLFDYTMDKYFG